MAVVGGGRTESTRRQESTGEKRREGRGGDPDYIDPDIQYCEYVPDDLPDAD